MSERRRTDAQLERALRALGRDLAHRIAQVYDRRARWLERPHALDVRTAAGSARFSVEGNVLIWTRAGITLRLETSLELEDALAIARSIR